jgi:hypothetical protein
MDPAVREELDRLRELALLNLQTSNNNLEAIGRIEQLVAENAEAIAQLRRTTDYLLSKDG